MGKYTFYAVIVWSIVAILSLYDAKANDLEPLSEMVTSQTEEQYQCDTFCQIDYINENGLEVNQFIRESKQ